MRQMEEQEAHGASKDTRLIQGLMAGAWSGYGSSHPRAESPVSEDRPGGLGQRFSDLAENPGRKLTYSTKWELIVWVEFLEPEPSSLFLSLNL